MAAKDDKCFEEVVKLKSPSASYQLIDQPELYSRTDKSGELPQPSLSYSEYEKLPKEVVDNVPETNPCCLKALLHYSGFELLSESPDLVIQCRTCKMKLQTKNDECDLDLKNKMPCKNDKHKSVKTIVLTYLHSSKSKEKNENEFLSEHSVPQLSEREYEEALESYEPNIFNHKELGAVCIDLCLLKIKSTAELIETNSKLKEREQVIREQDLELKRREETIVKKQSEYADLEKATIPKWNQHIQERADYIVTIKQLKAIIDEAKAELKEKSLKLERKKQVIKEQDLSLKNKEETIVKITSERRNYNKDNK